MKKYLFLFLLAAGIVLLFPACNDDNGDGPPPPPPPPAVTKYYYPPLVTINTTNSEAITSKENYLDATIKIEERDSSGNIVQTLFDATTEIRGRGNSTWGMPKKPYKMKLTDKSAIMGMPTNKHWVLLANYSDKTLMRNELAFEISRRMGFEYTPRSVHVDVVLNGNREGNYMFCEHVRVDDNRVNVPELKKKDTNITGGYLLEIDDRRSDEAELVYFETEVTRRVLSIKSPSEPTPDNQRDYIVEHVQKMENAMYGIGGVNPVTELPKYLDLKSFIDYYLLTELSKNVDGRLNLSTFIYKKRDDDKLYFGPVWDYDIAFGNVNYDSGQYTDGWIARASPWYAKTFSYPVFEQMLKNRWKELRQGELSSLAPYIEDKKAHLMVSQSANFQRWPILNTAVWPNPQVAGTYGGEISYLKDWVSRRMAWMDSQLR